MSKDIVRVDLELWVFLDLDRNSQHKIENIQHLDQQQYLD